MSEQKPFKELYGAKAEYHKSEWEKARKAIVKELREISDNGFPETQTDWEIIAALSGPEEGNIFDKENVGNSGYNETEARLATAIDVAKEVTAKRLTKEVSEVTLEDIRSSGPIVYFNGLAAQNEFLATEDAMSILEERYGFPREKLKITTNPNIKHTGHQFLDFNEQLPPEGQGKMVLVSDLYHLPRMRRYLGLDTNNLTPENTVLYPAKFENGKMRLNVRLTLDEIRKIYPYIEKGILPSENFSQENNENT